MVALEGPEEWCEAARKFLERGLQELGIGAKTSSGYGRLVLETPFKRELQMATRVPAHQARRLREKICALGIDGFPEASAAVRVTVQSWLERNNVDPAQLRNLSQEDQAWFALYLPSAATPAPPPLQSESLVIY